MVGFGGHAVIIFVQGVDFMRTTQWGLPSL
jgi:hypothetical protein